MKKSVEISWMKLIMAALILIAAIVGAYLIIQMVKEAAKTEITIGSDKKIQVTPNRIAEIKQLRQWEFLSVVDEVVIDTVRYNPILADDRLTCIYYGTVRLGIDLDKAPSDWAVNVNDTINLTLPGPSILDDRYIDEARTRVFYQHGKWSTYASEKMYKRAAAQMRAYALTPENIEQVRAAAVMRFTELFKAIGAKEVNVSFAQ